MVSDRKGRNPKKQRLISKETTGTLKKAAATKTVKRFVVLC